MKTIYLDNGATTEIDPLVHEEIARAPFGNPSSIHHIGIQAKKALDESRKIIADSLKVDSDEIIFTSGGTESNNLAIKGVSDHFGKGHIITTKIEHDCVLNSCKWLETKGFEVTYLDVDKEGFVSADDLKSAIRDDTILVSIIHGNNEIGVLQDLGKLYTICKESKVIFHTDACQSFCKVPIDSTMADMITINSHKIHGPKGVGALYVRKGIEFSPLNHGGGQERNNRSGTENLPSIIGFAKASQITTENDLERMRELRDYFIDEVLKIPDTILNGPREQRLCNNVNISFRFIEGESIISMLDIEGICCSTGSACSSRSLEPSHVMMAIDGNPERAHGSVRFSISKYTTKEELETTLSYLKKAVEKLREISPLR